MSRRHAREAFAAPTRIDRGPLTLRMRIPEARGATPRAGRKLEPLVVEIVPIPRPTTMVSSCPLDSRERGPRVRNAGVLSRRRPTR